MVKPVEFGPPRCIILNRVSTESQEDRFSLDSQDEENRAHIARRGGVVVASLQEVVSGAFYQSRSALQEALRLIERGEADALVTFDLSRFSRHAGYQQIMLERLSHAGGQLWVTTLHLDYNEDNELTPESELNAGVNGQFNQYHRKKIRADCRRGLRKAASQGIQPARGYMPYGYHVVRKADVLRGTYPAGSEGTYVIVEDEAGVVRIIYARYAELRSVRRLANWLNEQGIRAPKGGLWLPPTLYNLMRNPIYKGVGTYGRRRHRIDEQRIEKGLTKHYTVPAPEGSGITFPVPAIVEESLWEKANALLHNGNHERSCPRGSKYLLTGFAHCSLCGRRLYGMKNSDRNYRQPHSFGCSGWYPVHKGVAPRCEPQRFTGPLLEELIAEALCRVLERPDLLHAAQRRWESDKERRAQSKTRQSEITRLRREVERLRSRETEAARLALEARLAGSDGSVYEDLRQKAEIQRRQQEIALASLEARNQQQQVGRVEFEGLDTSAIVATLRDPEVATADRREILENLIEKIYPIPAAEGQLSRRNYRCGGVSIVLRTGVGPVYVLRNTITRLGTTHTHDVQMRQRTTEITLEIYPESPFPSVPPDARKRTRKT